MRIPYVSKNLVALAAICLAALMFGLEISSVPVILPALETVLHGDFKDMQWIMNAYTIACTTVLMAVGTLADRYGRRRVFVVSLLIFGVTSLACGLATSPSILIASRFLQGMGGGAMFICLVAILSHQFQEGRERSRAFAAWGIVFGIGLGFGPIIGAAIIALSNWQWVFLIHVPLTIVTLCLVFGGMTESRDPEAKRLDVLGIIALSLSVFGLTYYITQGSDLGFSSLPAIAILAATAAGFAIFVLVEKLSSRPMFDFSVFKIPNFSGAIMGSMGMNFSFWPLMIYLPIYFQGALGYQAVPAGLSLLAYTLPTVLVPPLAEHLSRSYQPRIVIPFGLFTIGLGFMLMWLGCDADHASWLTMLPGLALSGIGLGLTITPVTNTTTGAVPGNRSGMASGIDMSARLISLAINIALMGFILLSGTLSYLTNAFSKTLGPAQLRLLAEKVAAGDFSSFQTRFPELAHLDTGGIVRTALVHGFSLVLLYGGIGVWILATLSFVIFNTGKRTVQVAS